MTKPELPPLPPVPLAPMGPRDKRALMGCLRAVDRDDLSLGHVFEYARQCYARIWVSLALDSGMLPKECLPSNPLRNGDIKAQFYRAVDAIGLHDRKQAAWWANEIAILAAGLWQEAMDNREPKHQSLGVTAVPPYARALGYGG